MEQKLIDFEDEIASVLQRQYAYLIQTNVFGGFIESSITVVETHCGISEIRFFNE